MQSVKRLTNWTSNYFDACEPAWRQGQKDDQWLWIIAIVMTVLGALVLTLGNQHALFVSANRWLNELLPTIAWANITFVGDTMVALTIGLLFTCKYPKLALAILIAALWAAILVQVSKHILDLNRPAAVINNDLFIIIGPAFKSNSMPSGHTATALTLVALLWRCVPNLKWRFGLLLAGLLIGISRIAAGVHWPADICFGAALGLIASWCGLKLSDRITLHPVGYAIISTILLLVASVLFTFSGGLPHTLITAKLLSLGVIIHWLVSWYLVFGNRKTDKLYKLDTL